jgi:hypothetical protein
MAFYEGSGIITNKDYNPFVVIPEKREEYDVFYLLALLNSKLFSFLYTKKSAIALKDDFRQTTLGELRDLPIKTADKQNQHRVGEKAVKLSELHQQYQEIKRKMKRRVRENFGVDPENILQDITSLSFEHFRGSIEKKSKKRFSLGEQDEWESYFAKHVELLKAIRNNIVVHENQIDEEVYSLYGITKKEKELIERSLLERDY